MTAHHVLIGRGGGRTGLGIRVRLARMAGAEALRRGERPGACAVGDSAVLRDVWIAGFVDALSSEWQICAASGLFPVERIAHGRRLWTDMLEAEAAELRRRGGAPLAVAA